MKMLFDNIKKIRWYHWLYLWMFPIYVSQNEKTIIRYKLIGDKTYIINETAHSKRSLKLYRASSKGMWSAIKEHLEAE